MAAVRPPPATGPSGARGWGGEAAVLPFELEGRVTPARVGEGPPRSVGGRPPKIRGFPPRWERFVRVIMMDPP